jgi:Leucine-rich repeat (LRR) protein
MSEGDFIIVIGLFSDVEIITDLSQYTLNGGYSGTAQDLADASFKKNIFFTTTLADLGLSTFDELTNEIVADWIDSLEIVENDNEIYYFEVTDELSYNFDVTADWEGNEITNQSVFENYISATVSDFSLVEGRLRCNIQTSNEYIYLNNLGVTNINIFSYEGILELDLSDNNLLVFNPSKPLPDTLTKLFIDNNQIVDFNPALQLPMLTELSLEGNLIVQFGFNNLPLTLLKLNLSGNLIEVFNLNLSGLTSLERVFLDGNNLSFLSPENVLPPSVWQFTIASNQIDSAGWVASESWASAQPLFDPGCGLETNLNIDTAFGTGFETILFTKNANITD